MSSARVVTPEHVDPKQLELSEKILAYAKIGGVIVAVLLKGDSVQPITLRSGELHLVRISSSSAILSESTQNKFLKLHQDIQSKSERVVLSCGEFFDKKGRRVIFSVRPFHQLTLAEYLNLDPSKWTVSAQDLVFKLTQLLAYWHEREIYHGNICVDNILLTPKADAPTDIVIGDFGFKVLDLQAQKRSGEANWNNREFDLIAIAAIIERLISAQLTNQQRDILRKAQDPQAIKTLAAKNLVEAFSPFISSFNSSSNSEMYPETPQRVLVKDSAALAQQLEGTVVFSPDIVARIRAEAQTQDLLEPQLVNEPVSIEPASRPSKPVAQPSSGESKPSKAAQTAKSETSHTKPAKKQSSSSKTQSGITTYVLGLAVLCGLVIFIWKDWSSSGQRDSSTKNSSQASPTPAPLNPEYLQLWSSGLAPRMQQVVVAAIERRDASAQNVIISDLVAGNKKPGVAASLIRLAFDPRWENQLTASDRLIALRLGLSQLYPLQLEPGFSFSEVHPAVILALLSNVDGSEAGFAALAGVPIDNMFGLPADIGVTFENLKKLGVTQAGSAECWIVAQALAGQISSKDLTSVLKLQPTPLQQVKLFGLVALALEEAQLDQIWKAVLEVDLPIAGMLKWFGDNPLVEWNKISIQERMHAISSKLPDNWDWQFYADLARFPDNTVAQLSAQKTATMFAGEEDSVNFLIASIQQISRSSLIFLLNLFKSESDAFRRSVLTQWLSTEPDSKVVLGWLIVRNMKDSEDLVNGELASYLIGKDWDRSIAPLDLLLLHPSVSLRAQAYSRLDSTKPGDKALLEKMKSNEPNERLRTEILRKLGIEE